MKLVVDMNLPPTWVPVLEAGGHTAVHWSSVGDHKATDSAVMEWAQTNGYVVFTLRRAPGTRDPGRPERDSDQDR